MYILDDLFLIEKNYALIIKANVHILILDYYELDISETSPKRGNDEYRT